MPTRERSGPRPSPIRATTGALTGALLFALPLAGCGKANFNPETATAVTVAPVLPVPSGGDLYTAQRDDRIGPGDKLEVAVFRLDELNRTVIVDGTGSISLPLVGRMQALGKTTSELAHDIETRLGQRYLQDPQVNVAIAETVSQRFTIYGAVARPGLYAAVGNETLTQAIAQASGTADYARKDEVVVFRTVGGRKLAARFDLNAIDGGRADDPAIYPNDRIVIGTNTGQQFLRDIAPLTPILGVFYQIF